MTAPDVRALTRRAEQLGRRFVWWSRTPRRLLVPPWWRWTLELCYALAGDFVAWRGSTMAEWPPRLE